MLLAAQDISHRKGIMKILKCGADLDNWCQKCICNHCKSELEYNITDVKSQHVNGDWREPSFYEYWLVCPVCTKHCELSDKDWPDLVLIKVKGK